MLTAFGRELLRLMAERQYTVDELVANAAKAGYFIDDDVLFSHMTKWDSWPQAMKHVRGPAHALDLGYEDAIRLVYAYLFDK